MLRLEEKQELRNQIMRQMIPEKDTNVAKYKSGPGKTVAQTKTSGLRSKAVESKINTGLKKTTAEKGSVSIMM